MNGWYLNNWSESEFTGWKDEQDLNVGKKMNSNNADSESIDLENLLNRIILIPMMGWQLVGKQKLVIF